jgi:DNA-binding HxlR family transcriptional regulator/putative sterol carrier protein
MKKRNYNQSCSLAHSLDIVGERWTLLLIRELLIGPKRFKELLKGLSGIGTNLLTARLKEMEDAGLVEKDSLPPPSGSVVYQLTRLGNRLEPAILELIKWGMSLPPSTKKGQLSLPDWDMVAMKALFDPEKAKGFKICCEIHLSGITFNLFIDGRNLEVASGKAQRPDLVIKTDRDTLKKITFGHLNLDEAIRKGQYQLEGSKRIAKRLINIFRPKINSL